jgi:3-oxoacyl-[acyl-carrier protein] reductase
MTGRLKGKTAVVTGAARGLGRQIALRFVGEGARVIINDVSLDTARKTASEIGAEAGLAADVSDSASVNAMFDEVGRLFKGLDILVNNAGISGMEGRNDIDQMMAQRVKIAQDTAAGKPQTVFIDGALNTTDAVWRRMQAVHVDGTFFCCRAALALMNPQLSGVIINMSSVLGTSGRGANVPYSTAKAAITGLTRSLAFEVAPRNIRVNAIAPGWIDTDMTAPLSPLKPLMNAQIPLRKFGEADDIAWAAVYLASDEARYMTGQIVSPNGGFYMSQ